MFEWMTKVFGNRAVDAEKAALYLDGGMKGAEEEGWESLLAGDGGARETVALAAACEDEARQPSSAALNHALSLALGRRESVAEFIVQLKDRAVEVLSTTARPVTLELVPAGALRGNLAAAQEGRSVFAHSFGLYQIYVAFRAAAGDNLGLHVSLDGPDVNEKDVLFRLWEGDREVRSIHARRGAAVFENVTPGSYRMRVHENHGEIGAINLELMKAKA